MLNRIADDLQRLDASIDVIDQDQARSAIEAALSVTREQLEAMTAEVFYMSAKEEEYEHDRTKYTYTTPYFQRFAKDLASNSKNDAAKRKESRNEYNPKQDGPWTWSYEKNQVVWIEDRDDTTVSKSGGDRPDMDNKAAEKDSQDKIVPAKHNRFWDSVQAVITIPFYYRLGTTFTDKANKNENERGLISHQANGFISFEFSSPKKYKPEQLKELIRMSEPIADLIWKCHAWKDSCDGTGDVVKKFANQCSELRKYCMPNKTGLFAHEIQDQRDLVKLIENAFSDKKIKMKIYDGGPDALGLLEPRQDAEKNIRNVHFAVFDITQKNLVVDMLVGMMFNERKPCLILHNNSESARHPLIRQLAGRGGGDTNWLLYPWFYQKPDGEEYSFFQTNGEPKTWREVWNGFLDDVAQVSPTYQMASDSA